MYIKRVVSSSFLKDLERKLSAIAKIEESSSSASCELQQKARHFTCACNVHNYLYAMCFVASG